MPQEDDDSMTGLFDVRDMLSRLKDATFEPYRRSLRQLQIIDTSPPPAKRTSSGGTKRKRGAFSGEELKLGIGSPSPSPSVADAASRNSIPSASGVSTRLRRPLYASLDRLSEEAKRRVRELSVECAALERRLLLAPAEEEAAEDAYDRALRELGVLLARLSHLEAYRHVVDVTMPFAEQTAAASEAESLFAERERMLERAKHILTQESGESTSELVHAMRAAMMLERNGHAALTGSSPGSLGETPAWPGKHHLVVLNPPRTDSLSPPPPSPASSSLPTPLAKKKTTAPKTTTPKTTAPKMSGGGGKNISSTDTGSKDDSGSTASMTDHLHPRTQPATMAATSTRPHTARIGFLFRYTKKKRPGKNDERAQHVDTSKRAR